MPRFNFSKWVEPLDDEALIARILRFRGVLIAARDKASTRENENKSEEQRARSADLIDPHEPESSKRNLALFKAQSFGNHPVLSLDSFSVTGDLRSLSGDEVTTESLQVKALSEKLSSIKLSSGVNSSATPEDVQLKLRLKSKSAVQHAESDQPSRAAPKASRHAQYSFSSDDWIKKLRDLDLRRPRSSSRGSQNM